VVESLVEGGQPLSTEEFGEFEESNKQATTMCSMSSAVEIPELDEDFGDFAAGPVSAIVDDAVVVESLVEGGQPLSTEEFGEFEESNKQATTMCSMSSAVEIPELAFETVAADDDFGDFATGPVVTVVVNEDVGDFAKFSDEYCVVMEGSQGDHLMQVKDDVFFDNLSGGDMWDSFVTNSSAVDVSESISVLTGNCIIDKEIFELGVVLGAFVNAVRYSCWFAKVLLMCLVTLLCL
jgi:hypothetical protein